ncbi:Uroporphyrinogen decarboxylase in heme biosynthesis [Hypoxylon texense]
MDQTDHVAGLDPDAQSRGAWLAKPIRRRNRMINRRKLKCSKTSPTCTNCIKTGRDCLYIGPRLDEASQMRLAEIKEKQGTLERELERDVAKSTASKSTVQQSILADGFIGDDEEHDLEATPLAALDLTYDDDADEAGDMIDLGIQIGKMRITERIGGLSRPRISEEISAGITGSQPPGSEHAQQGRQAPGTEQLPDFLKPGNEYMVPSSGFFFGQLGESPSILQYLPHRAAADRLIRQYYVSVHPIAPCAHRPTLEATYATFWEDINAGYEPRCSMQAIVFAAMFSGAICMDESSMLVELGGYPKANWVNSLKMGTESALSKANFLRTTKLETMQAFIMYMLPLCRAEVSRAHSVLVGAAVRMAECMGLHRDGIAYGLTPLETHVRRLIWHQLCFLDIRTCEAQGPKPVIRRDDYDTKLPLNCNEEDLTRAITPPEPSDSWTTNTLALIRFEINEMMRTIWLDRRRLATRKTTLTSVLAKIENFRRRMSEKYDHLLDAEQPIQRYAKCVMYLLTYRLHVMVLHPYHSNAATPMPPRLNQLLITAGIKIVELAIQLETNTIFQNWAWYLGAYFQYQVALLLATEAYFRPQSRDAKRIWSCLDYVFDMDCKLPPEAKGVQLLAEIQNKTAMYTRMRKMRGPTSLSRAVPGQNVVAGMAQPSIATRNLPQQRPQPLGVPQDVPKVEPGYTPPPPPIAHGPPVPPPPMVFAGVSDGQALWSIPPNHTSPGSDSSSVEHGQQAHTPGLGGTGLHQGNIMDTLDWDTINALFPTDPQTGGLSIQGFHDPSFSIASWST